MTRHLLSIPSRPPHSRRGARGFTLVELLVVIGIIALLIGILLPTLSSARQSANAVVCLSNMRQMGQATNLYANDHGTVPWGMSPPIAGVGTATPYAPRWFESLSAYVVEAGQVENYGMGSGHADRVPTHPIFADMDTSPYEGAPGPAGAGINHYMANIRVFGENRASDIFKNPAGGEWAEPKKLGSIRESANTAAIWDSHQVNFGSTSTHPINRGSAWPTSRYMDPHPGFGPSGNSGAFYAEGFYSIRGLVVNTPVDDRHEGTPINNMFDQDIPDPSHNGPVERRPGVRTRHQGNEVANVLFVDGHAEGLRADQMTRGTFAVTQY